VGELLYDLLIGAKGIELAREIGCILRLYQPRQPSDVASAFRENTVECGGDFRTSLEIWSRVSCDSSKVWRLYLSGVVWRSQACPTISAEASQDRIESICSAGVGGLHAATITTEMTRSRFTRI